MGYPGGKSGPGVYHRLINLMPPHPMYCEPFLGGGAVMRLKRPAAYNIGVDLDGDVIASWRSHSGGNAVEDRSGGNATPAGTVGMPGIAASAQRHFRRALQVPVSGGTAGGGSRDAVEVPLSSVRGGSAASRRRRTVESPLEASGGGPAAGRSRFRFLRGDALTFLASYPFEGPDLIYCDPPYLRETRSGGRLYRHELEDWQHEELLATILTLPCRVMISGYWSEMYAFRLQRWNSISFEAMTRGGMATEWLWFNYEPPVELHDYRFLGEGNRQRTDLKRQKARWIARLERMPVLQRQALLSAIASQCGNAAEVLDGGQQSASD